MHPVSPAGGGIKGGGWTESLKLKAKNKKLKVGIGVNWKNIALE
jgi:hypothetical protein